MKCCKSCIKHPCPAELEALADMKAQVEACNNYHNENQRGLRCLGIILLGLGYIASVVIVCVALAVSGCANAAPAELEAIKREVDRRIIVNGVATTYDCYGDGMPCRQTTSPQSKRANSRQYVPAGQQVWSNCSDWAETAKQLAIQQGYKAQYIVYDTGHGWQHAVTQVTMPNGKSFILDLGIEAIMPRELYARKYYKGVHVVD